LDMIYKIKNKQITTKEGEDHEITYPPRPDLSWRHR